MLKLVKGIRKLLVSVGSMLLCSACVILTGIIGEAYFGWAVFPGSEGHVPMLKFFLLFVGVTFVVLMIVVGPFVALKTIWSLRKVRIYVEKLEDTIDMIYTIVHCTPDEYIKGALKDVFRYQGVGQDGRDDPSSQNKIFFRPIIDTQQDSPGGDVLDLTFHESSSGTKANS